MVCGLHYTLRRYTPAFSPGFFCARQKSANLESPKFTRVVFNFLFPRMPYPNSDTLPSNLPPLSAGASCMPHPNSDTLLSNLPPLSAGASWMPYPNSDTLPSNLPPLSTGALSCCKQPRQLYPKVM